MLLGQNPGERRPATRALVSAVLLSHLLMACAVPQSDLPEPVPAPEQTLQPGSMLRIQVWRQPDYSGDFVLGVEGRLVHPLYQEVSLEGLALPQARAAIERFLARYLQGAQVTVEPLYRVSVGGEVRQPAVYQVERGTTVAEAIALAGGPTVLARLDEVTLARGNQIYYLRIGQDMVTAGQLVVASGDQIFIDRQSTFSIWRDVVGPVATLAALTLTILRIGESTQGN
jgi:protein involved in polysaccharide export with SLBB domain